MRGIQRVLQERGQDRWHFMDFVADEALLQAVRNDSVTAADVSRSTELVRLHNQPLSGASPRHHLLDDIRAVSLTPLRSGAPAFDALSNRDPLEGSVLLRLVPSASGESPTDMQWQYPTRITVRANRVPGHARCGLVFILHDAAQRFLIHPAFRSFTPAVYRHFYSVMTAAERNLLFRSRDGFERPMPAGCFVLREEETSAVCDLEFPSWGRYVLLYNLQVLPASEIAPLADNMTTGSVMDTVAPSGFCSSLVFGRAADWHEMGTSTKSGTTHRFLSVRSVLSSLMQMCCCLFAEAELYCSMCLSTCQQNPAPTDSFSRPEKKIKTSAVRGICACTRSHSCAAGGSPGGRMGKPLKNISEPESAPQASSFDLQFVGVHGHTFSSFPYPLKPTASIEAETSVCPASPPPPPLD